MKIKTLQADFAIFKFLLRDANGLLAVDFDENSSTFHVRVDRSKITSDGKSSLGRVLHCLRCTANAAACKEFYEPLKSVKGEEELWRKVVVSKPGFLLNTTECIDSKRL